MNGDWKIVMDLAINVACFVAGAVVSMTVKWRGKQPGNNMAIAIALFVTFFLWYLTGKLFGIDYHLTLGNGVSHRHAIRFFYLSLLPLLYMIYLVLMGKAAARD